MALEFGADNPYVESRGVRLHGECPEPLRPDVETLLPVFYEQLKRVARSQRGRLAPFSTLNTTAIVHESYLRLAKLEQLQSRGHFLRAASVAMRHVIVDGIRRRMADKRGGEAQRVNLDCVESEVLSFDNAEQTLAVHQAIEQLAERSPRLADIAVCRYFCGYTDAEIAEALDVSLRTIQRDWVTARAWLARRLKVTAMDAGD